MTEEDIAYRIGIGERPAAAVAAEQAALAQAEVAAKAAAAAAAFAAAERAAENEEWRTAAMGASGTGAAVASVAPVAPIAPIAPEDRTWEDEQTQVAAAVGLAAATAPVSGRSRRRGRPAS